MKWIHTLLDRGESIRSIKQMRLSDIELMVEAYDLVNQSVDKETTLDKAFPFLFG